MILMTALFTGIFSAGYAQYTGPGSKAGLKTVKEVSDNALKLDRKDTMVKLQGFIVEQMGDDNYWFKDSTGKIRIEIDKKHLPATPFNDETKMTIIGEVDYDLLEGTEIEVKQVEFAAPANKENQAGTAG
jgi:uncharacterized protein (TIGR00156 family)